MSWKAFVKSTMLYDNQASDVYTDLHDKASYADELPQTALDYYRDVLLYRIYTNAQKYGTDMNTLLSSGMMGSSYDSWMPIWQMPTTASSPSPSRPC